MGIIILIDFMQNYQRHTAQKLIGKMSYILLFCQFTTAENYGIIYYRIKKRINQKKNLDWKGLNAYNIRRLY